VAAPAVSDRDHGDQLARSAPLIISDQPHTDTSTLVWDRTVDIPLPVTAEPEPVTVTTLDADQLLTTPKSVTTTVDDQPVTEPVTTKVVSTPAPVSKTTPATVTADGDHRATVTALVGAGVVRADVDTVAAAVALLSGNEPMSRRAIGREVGMSHVTVGKISSALTSSGSAELVSA
jgi:hypothetical protein